MSLSRRAWIVFATVLVLTLGFDQGSKAWARGTLPAHQAVAVVDGYWDWELAYNDGAAFSNVRGKRLLLELIAAAALVGMAVFAWRSAPEQRVRRIALGLVAGGTLGNLVDRLRDGAVVDFVRWRVGDHLWPIFNVADVALVTGVALLLLENVLERRRARTIAV